MENERKALLITEKKERINRIKEKFNNLSMDDKTAEKIEKLEVTNKALVAASVVAGIITTVDLIVPDPILGLDEIALSAITSLLTGATHLVDKKIKELATIGSTEINIDEVNKLSNDLINVADKIKSGRKL